MTLTLSHGPLSGSPPETTNYEVEGPRHRLFFDEFPRWVRGLFGDETIADTRSGRMLHETGYLPVLYFPEQDVRSDLLRPSDKTTHCPFKGDATYFSIAVADRLAEDAIWTYPEPLAEARWLRGYLAFYWDAIDAWYEEDERVEGHLRDPYHRVDVRESSRHVRVLADGEVIAETRRPKVLFETGLPNRYYIPPDDVRQEALEPSDTHTICPYKGTASYRSLHATGARFDDVAWIYPSALEAALKAEGHLCFSHDALAIEVDGERVE